MKLNYLKTINKMKYKAENTIFVIKSKKTYGIFLMILKVK